jgi:simple sugar transport system ATP-binding protein
MITMRNLANAGTSIVFITHKLREVKAVADTITVIRLGKVVGSASPDASTDELAALMVGRDVELTVSKNPPKLGDEVFVVEDLTLFGPGGQRLLDDISFSIREGEVLAIAGVQGNGQTELTETIVGLRDKAKGSIRLYGTEIIDSTVKQVLDAGVGFVPEDRKVDGLVAEFSVAENLMLDRSDGSPFAKGLVVDIAHRDAFADASIAEFDIRTPGHETLVGRLSGGNQQKVVLARELGRDLKLFVASQPTRGVDVGSIEFIHERIVAVRDSGVPVLIISTELDEVLALADRIAVMYRGAIIDIVPADTPREQLGRLMAGVHE